MFEIGVFALTLGALLGHLGEVKLLYAILAIAGGGIWMYMGTRALLLGVYIVCAGILGVLVSSVHQPHISENALGMRTITGNVVSVDRELDRTAIVAFDPATGIRIKTNMTDNSVLPGDTVAIHGQVTLPEDFVTDTGRRFPYRAYLQSKGVSAVIDRGDVRIIEKGKWSFIRTAIVVRHRAADIFAIYISFPSDGIVAGMLIGYQGGIPQSIQDLFRNTGVLHVLVLSGYNITLLAGVVLVLLRRIPFRMRVLIAIVMIIGIVLISGAGVASIRAGIMGSIALLSGIAVRSYTPLRALLIASVYFLVSSPYTIWSDPGFHLSFLATLFMVLLLPKVTAWFWWIPQLKYVPLRELFVLAVCIPIFMLPYTMYFSGFLPFSTVPANILLAIITPLIMILGALLIGVSWIAPLASIVGTTISTIGNFLITLLRTLSHLPIWNTPPISWWGVVIIYSALIGILFWNDIIQYLLQLRNSFRQRPSSSDS